MTLTRLLIALSLLILAAGLAGCGSPPPLTDDAAPSATEVIASADKGYTMTMAQLYQLISESRKYPEGGVMPISEVRDFLDDQLIDTLAGFLADSVDLDTNYTYHRLYKQRYYDYLIREYASHRITSKVHIDSQQVVDYYDKHPEAFRRPQKVLLYHIMAAWDGLIHGADSMFYRTIPLSDRAAAVKKYIDHVESLLDNGLSFKEAAITYSHDAATVKDSGYVGWVARGVYRDPFDSIAFHLTPGTYSKPYMTGNGWHIIYIADYDSGGVAPLDTSLYSKIKNRLASQESNKMAKPLIDSLEKQIHLTYNEAALDTNVYLINRQTWAGILNGRDTIDFNDLRSLEEQYRARYHVNNTTVDQKRMMIHDIARHYIVVQAARAAGIDTLAESRRQEVAYRHRYSKALELLNVSPSTWSPPDSMVANYYNHHLGRFKITKPLKVQQIITEDSTFALFLRDQALSGVDFLGLARQYYPGKESIREAAADLGWIGPEDVSPEFYRAASVLRIGGVSMPVRTQYGFQIIKLIDRRVKKTVTQARGEIVPILRQQHQREIRDRFRDKVYAMYHVRISGSIPPVQLKPAIQRRQEQKQQENADLKNETPVDTLKQPEATGEK